MKGSPMFYKLNWLVIGLTVGCVGVSSFFTIVHSETIELEINFQLPQLPGNGAPADRTGGGERRTGESCEIQDPLTALLPAKKREGKDLLDVWGDTTKEFTSIFVYVPYQLEHIKSSEFILRNESDNEVLFQKRNLALSQTPSIVEIPIEVPLEIGKNYKFELFLDINCNPEENSDTQPDFVQGWVQRVELSPNLEQQLNDARSNPLKRVKVYAEARIWQDALKEITLLRRNEPDNVKFKKALADLLQDANWDEESNDTSDFVESITSLPIVPVDMQQEE